MAKLRSIQHNFVTQTQLNTQHSKTHPDHPEIGRLIDETAFIQAYPDPSLTETEKRRIWRHLIGSHPGLSTQAHSPLPYSFDHPQIQYVSESALTYLLNHIQYFEFGIDYFHLPAGFAIIKNPKESGVRNLLHFYPELVNESETAHPLAITMQPATTEISNIDSLILSEFEPHFSLCHFLRSLSELRPFPSYNPLALINALRHFMIVLDELGLRTVAQAPCFLLYNPDLHPENPILLLSRWEKILKNPRLSKQNRRRQWQDLPKLPCRYAHQMTRILYESSPSFLIPEMDLAEVVIESGKVLSYCTIERRSDISPLLDSQLSDPCYPDDYALALRNFWRYISCKGSEFSIEWYEAALKHSQNIRFKEKKKEDPWSNFTFSDEEMAAEATQTHIVTHDLPITEERRQDEAMHLHRKPLNNEAIADSAKRVKLLMLGILAGSSYRKTKLVSENEQSTLLKQWAELCSFLSKSKIEVFQIENTLAFLFSLEKRPDIPTCRWIIESLINFESSHVLTQLRTYEKTQQRETQLRESIKELGAAFVKGRRLFSNLTIDAYLKLTHYLAQYEANDYSHITKKAICRLLSHFQLNSERTIETILKRLKAFKNEKALNFCSKQLSTLTTVQSIENLYCLFEKLEQVNEYENTPVKWVDLLSENFPGQFEASNLDAIKEKHEYFLNEMSFFKNWFLSYNFSDKSEHALIEFFEAITDKDHAPRHTPDSLVLAIYRVYTYLTESDFFHLLKILKLLIGDIKEEYAELALLFCDLAKIKTIFFIELFYQSTLGLACEANQSFLATLTTFHQILTDSESLKSCETDVAQMIAFICLRAKGTPAQTLLQICLRLLPLLDFSPNTKPLITEMLSHYASDDYFNQLTQLTSAIETLKTIASPDDSQFFYTLISHFKDSPDVFLKIMIDIRIIDTSSPAEIGFQAHKNFLRYASHLLNEQAPFAEFNQLCQSYARADAELKAAICQILMSLPVAPLNKLLNWIGEGTNALAVRYCQFSLLPYGERRSDYQFSINKYLLQKTLFKGVDGLFNDKLGASLAVQLQDYREMSVESLNTLLEDTSKIEDTQKRTLQYLCLTIEFLARTCSQVDNDNRISQELNTTQVMTLAAMLLCGYEKILNQIDTGEGKSRILMVLCAVKALNGFTVDFLTSNFSLALRDYLAYHTFFDALGIRVNCIHLNTPPRDYLRSDDTRGVINFSDQSQLILLRNRTRLDYYQGNREAQSGFSESFSDMLEKSCLIMDEEDAFRVDQASHPYNFAMSSEFYRRHEWIYKAILDYARKRKTLPYLSEKVTEHDIHFLAAQISQTDFDSEHKRQFKTLSFLQLASWIEAAINALLMRRGVDYVTTPDTITDLRCLSDGSGTKRYGREIVVLDHGRPAEGSCFSDGVHQFLICIESETSRYPFVFTPQTNLVSTRYPHSFLDEYRHIVGASGTTRHEYADAFDDAFHYLVTPRELPCRRKDRPPLLCHDDQQQFNFIRDEICSALKRNKPILLICQNEPEAKSLFEKFQRDASVNLSYLQCVLSLTSKEEETQAIENAAIPGTLTLSTSMLSRGVDIRAPNLYVITTGLQSRADEQQTLGRAGRFGSKGKTRLILNLNDPTHPLKPGYNGKQLVNDAQEAIDETLVFNTEVMSIYADFLEEIHRRFFDTPLENQTSTGLEAWQAFLINLQTKWENMRQALLELLKNHRLPEFVAQFNHFIVSSIESANGLNLQCESPSFLLNEAKQEKIQRTLQFFQQKKLAKYLPIQKKYDVSDDGQARIYSCLFAQTRAILLGKRSMFANTRAWWQGRGVLFADLRATLNGQRPLFANLRATIEDLMGSKSNPTLSPPSLRQGA